MSHGETSRDSKVVDVVGIFGRVEFCGSVLGDEAFRIREDTS